MQKANDPAVFPNSLDAHHHAGTHFRPHLHPTPSPHPLATPNCAARRQKEHSPWSWQTKTFQSPVRRAWGRPLDGSLQTIQRRGLPGGRALPACRPSEKIATTLFLHLLWPSPEYGGGPVSPAGQNRAATARSGKGASKCPDA
jgi:hypothetical protein